MNKTKLDINLYDYKQEIIGWGGALSDSSIQNILSLTVNGTERLLEDYFGSDGLRYNMIRITIGGSDFSGRFYTNNDLNTKNRLSSSPSDDDLNLQKFALVEEDLLYKIPMLKLILNRFSRQNMKIFGSMWSPPIWMKTNNRYNKGYLKKTGTNGNFSDSYFSALANLKKKFLLAYKENSINFWGLTVMNEPVYAIQPWLQFNSMIFEREDYENYIANYLGPILKGDNQFEDLNIMIHDDGRHFLKTFVEPTLSNADVSKYIDGIAVHGYIDEEYHLMDYMAKKFNSKFILSTELCSGHKPFMEKALIGNWHRGIHYALDIIRSLQHSSSGWVDWNMALDTTGGPGWLGGRLDSPIIVDKQRDSYYRSPMYYVIGQFSRFVPAGSTRLSSIITNDNFDHHFEVIPFSHADTGKVILIVLNNNPYDVELLVRLQRDSNIPSVEHKYYPLNCAADSLTTFIIPDEFSGY